ncbi:MAG: hypothetical protein ACKOCB_11645 [Planctomycetia bacterium]
MLPLAILHVPKGAPPPAHAVPAPCFETCQRRIWIGLDGSLPCSTQQGEDAYALLLEVVCGLHSRVLAETEVQGQFRDFSRAHRSLEPFASWLLEDAKAIRTQVLAGVGGHSYAGVVRRWCGPGREILVLGRGQLARKVATGLQVVRQLPPRDVSACHEALRAARAGCRVVVAAPIEDAVLGELRAAAPVGALWIDLRGERGSFRAERTLDDLYAEVEREQAQARAVLPRALAEVRRRARMRADRVLSRPMGWEDLAG